MSLTEFQPFHYIGLKSSGFGDLCSLFKKANLLSGRKKWRNLSNSLNKHLMLVL